jgi:hypothetical protein
MSDFVAETSNLSVADWHGGAEASSRLAALRESALQSNLATLEATLWVAETGVGSAGAALEMTKLARQTREQSLSLFRKVTAAR